ncbi:MAG: DUF5723 family protein [Calditrichota bacterium]
MIILLITLLCAGTVWAQAVDPQYLGHAGAHNLRQKNSAAFNWNPAVLSPERGFRMSFELPSVMAAMGNNAFSVAYWNSHIAGEDTLSESDKNSILDRIPDDGWQANGEVSVPVVGFTYNKFGGRVTVESYQNVSLPRDVVELVLKGNELNRRYEIGKFEGTSETVLDFTMGFGYRFEQEIIPDLHFGIGFHYYQGLYLADVARADGELIITSGNDSIPGTINTSSVIQTLTSKRGDGVGFDLGGLALLNNKWEVGLAVRQIGARMSWAVDENHLISYYTDSTGIAPDSLVNEDYVKSAFHYTDEEYHGGTYETHLPAIIQLNSVYRANSKWTILGDVMIRTESSARGSADIQVAGSGEYLAGHHFPLYGGLSVGGPLGWRFGLGGGLRFKGYELDLGWTWNGGMFNSAHGIGFGLSQRLKF